MKKVCTKCKEEKGLDQYKNIKGKIKKDGTRSILKRPSCKPCDSFMEKKWLEENPNYKKEWRKKNPEKVKEETLRAKPRYKKWREDNKEHCRAKANERRRLDKLKNGTDKYNIQGRKEIENLTDGYVISKITRGSVLTTAQVRKCPELIEVKREIIKINRLIKNNKL